MMHIINNTLLCTYKSIIFRLLLFLTGFLGIADIFFSFLNETVIIHTGDVYFDCGALISDILEFFFDGLQTASSITKIFFEQFIGLFEC